MNEIAKELLEDVEVGNVIRVRYGTDQDQVTTEGTVVKWTDNFLTLVKMDQRLAKIRLDDNLRSIEMIMDSAESKEGSQQVAEVVAPIEEVAMEDASSKKTPIPIAEYRVLRQMVELSPAKPYAFSEKESIDSVKTVLKASKNMVFRSKINSVIDSLNVAVKNHEVEYKYHNLRAKAIQTWHLCQEFHDYEALYLLLGILAIIAKDYEYALEPLIRAKRYFLASYSANKGDLLDSARVFSLCALLNKESDDVNQYIAETIVANKDDRSLKKMLEIYQEEQETCEKLASCAHKLFIAGKGSLDSDVTPYDSAYEATEKLLRAIPAGFFDKKSALSYWEEYQNYDYPVQRKTNETDNKEITGVIKNFNKDAKYGFITPNYYFYIEQVRDDSEEGILLRKLLWLGRADGLEVTFKLGKSPIKKGKNAATDIMLSSKGSAAAEKLASSLAEDNKKKKGFVSIFNSFYDSGTIQSGRTKYRFKISGIVDPWLKAYYQECFSPKEQDVSFEVNGRNAIKICWIDPDENDRQIASRAVTSDDEAKWADYLKRETFMNSVIELPDEDPYSFYRYSGLMDPEDASDSKNGVMLTWGGVSKVEPRIQKDEDQPSSTKVIKPSAIDGQAIQIALGDARLYAERARRSSISGRLEEAEKDFEKALQIGGFNESVVCDYISLSMRQEGKIDRAVELIEKYESQISRDKGLNLKIQVLDKKKDYLGLIPLYEEAFRKSASVTKKSHNLYRLIDAYMKLGRYDDALAVCRRWEVFYTQNRFSADADKLKNVAPSIKRHEAICYYYIGELEEARKIATDLIRANPADGVANSILDGTLGEGNESVQTDDQSQEDFWSSEPEDALEDSGSLITRYVRLLLQQTDISVSLKSRNIKDGQYIGTVKEGEEDVKKLVANKGRLSSKMRSDTLLSACKIVEQLEMRDDYKAKNEYYKYRLAGRAMASWGDYMVSQASQLDTTRMAYLYALRVLIQSKNFEQDWANAYNRYVKSYYMARVGRNSLDEYITQQNTKDPEGPNTDILIGNRIPDVLFPEFFTGILMLIKAIYNQKDRRNTFIDDLYAKNSELRESICAQMEVYTGKKLSSNPTRYIFKQEILKAVGVLEDKRNVLHSIILEASSILLSERLSEDMLSKLDVEKWKSFLTATDTARLSRIYYMMRRAQDYFNSGDFENRADCLRAIHLEANDLMQSIAREPTDVSYDELLPALQQIVYKVADKQMELYQKFLPKLSWNEIIQPFRTPEGTVQIQLMVQNDINYQSADSLQINNVQSQDVARFEAKGIPPTLRGGDEVEISLLVQLNENAISIGSFSAKICYSYKCNDAPDNPITKNEEVEFTFIIRDENFEPFKNPFSAYEGKLMDDDSMFVGRSTQIQKIIDMICPSENGEMNYGRAIAMYGQTRTGKSSLLYHLKKSLNQRYGDRILIWDIENIGELPSSESFLAQFLYNLLYVGGEAISDNRRLCSLVESEGLEPPLDDLLQKPDFAVILFNSYMKKLNAVLKRERMMIVLLIDEFTYLHAHINEGKISSDFMLFWKALLQNYCLFAIVAGQDDMPEFMREYKNEFACMELMKLTYLEERDAKQLIRKSLEDANNRDDIFRDDGAVHEIYSLTAGSAYLTIILCSKLVSYLNEKGAYMVTKGIVKEFLRTRAFGPNGFLMEVHFEAQLQERGHVELDDINRNLLLSIARLSQTTGEADINDIECIGLSREEIRTYADRLVDRNVLVREGGSKYWIQVKLLDRWLINTMGA